MKKIKTLFKKNPDNLGLVINEIDPDNAWALTDESIPTRKFDGTACAIINGELYQRYDAKKGKNPPEGAIPCQDPDPISGHHPFWVKCNHIDSSCKYHIEAFNALENKEDGTYELCGPKIQKNPEKLESHKLIKHSSEILHIQDLSFNGLKDFLSNPENDIEGIVFHNKNDGRMCKLRKSDFGIKRSKPLN